jgi:hypothetical protein
MKEPVVWGNTQGRGQKEIEKERDKMEFCYIKTP